MGWKPGEVEPGRGGGVVGDREPLKGLRGGRDLDGRSRCGRMASGCSVSLRASSKITCGYPTILAGDSRSSMSNRDDTRDDGWRDVMLLVCESCLEDMVDVCLCMYDTNLGGSALRPGCGWFVLLWTGAGADELDRVTGEDPCELLLDLRVLDGSSLLPLEREATPAADNRD